MHFSCLLSKCMWHGVWICGEISLLNDLLGQNKSPGCDFLLEVLTFFDTLLQGHEKAG